MIQPKETINFLKKYAKAKAPAVPPRPPATPGRSAPIAPLPPTPPARSRGGCRLLRVVPGHGGLPGPGWPVIKVGATTAPHLLTW